MTNVVDQLMMSAFPDFFSLLYLNLLLTRLLFVWPILRQLRGIEPAPLREYRNFDHRRLHVIPPPPKSVNPLFSFLLKLTFINFIQQRNISLFLGFVNIYSHIQILDMWHSLVKRSQFVEMCGKEAKSSYLCSNVSAHNAR